MRVRATPGRHALHVGDRVWPESNCYIDLWIELLHARGLDPVAALPFTLTADVEGDQWTFGKFPHADLRALYGIDIIELNVWRPLARTPRGAAGNGAHADRRGRCLLSRRHGRHVVSRGTRQDDNRHPALDSDARRLDYWHNAGAYEISGEDFNGLFNLDHSHPCAPGTVC